MRAQAERLLSTAGPHRHQRWRGDRWCLSALVQHSWGRAPVNIRVVGAQAVGNAGSLLYHASPAALLSLVAHSVDAARGAALALALSQEIAA